MININFANQNDLTGKLNLLFNGIISLFSYVCFLLFKMQWVEEVEHLAGD